MNKKVVKYIKMSDIGRYYAHLEVSSKNLPYKIVSVHPLGTDIRMVKSLLEQGYKLNSLK